MIHVIHTRTKIYLSNMHTNLNLHAGMLFNIWILSIHTFELNIIWFNFLNSTLWFWDHCICKSYYTYKGAEFFVVLLKVHIKNDVYRILFQSKMDIARTKIEYKLDLNWVGTVNVHSAKFERRGEVVVTVQNQNLRDGNYYCLSLPRKAYLLDFCRFR